MYELSPFFYAQITVLARNYQVKPVIGLSNMLRYSCMNYNSNTQQDSDLTATTSVEMPAILIGTNSTQDVEQDLVRRMCREVVYA